MSAGVQRGLAGGKCAGFRRASSGIHASGRPAPQVTDATVLRARGPARDAAAALARAEAEIARATA